MYTIHPVDLQSKADKRRFVELPYRLYRDHPQWVPAPKVDEYTRLNPQKHPFYEHSEAAFFLVEREGRDVGRLAVMENRRYNEYHGTRQAQFYLFECEDDPEAARLLFERAFEWARARGLDEIVGPKGFSAFDGYGMLVEGFEHRQMMTMMNYNYPYYPKLVEGLGFTKVVDFVSNYIHVPAFRLPERVHRIAERVRRRGSLQVLQLRNKADLRRWARKIGQTYNKAFVNNWEYYPLTEAEIQFVLNDLLLIANPRMLKLITYKGEEIVGFLFAFADVSAALQRARGRLTPWAIVDLLLEMRRTKWVSLNGAGILPEYQGIGGNALLYSEMEKTLREFNFEHADLTQVAESAVQMRADLDNLGSHKFKNHRVYGRKI